MYAFIAAFMLPWRILAGGPPKPQVPRSDEDRDVPNMPTRIQGESRPRGLGQAIEWP
jgi:hypothetical protein